MTKIDWQAILDPRTYEHLQIKVLKGHYRDMEEAVRDYLRKQIEAETSPTPPANPTKPDQPAGGPGGSMGGQMGIQAKVPDDEIPH